MKTLNRLPGLRKSIMRLGDKPRTGAPRPPFGYLFLAGKQADGSYVAIRAQQANGLYLRLIGKVE